MAHISGVLCYYHSTPLPLFGDNMKLPALLASLRETAREEWGDDILDQINEAVVEDNSVFEEKINTLEAGNAEATTQISSLKNELYDLSKLVPRADEDGDDTDNVDEDEPETDPIDDFFEEVE